MQIDDKRALLVGIDESAGSLTALRFAASEASLRDVSLKVVMVVEELTAATGPDLTDFAGLAMVPAIPLAEWAEKIEPPTQIAVPPRLTRAVEEALKTHPGVSVEIEAWQGRTATILIERSGDFAMLVVGARGHGGFSGLRLGSVAEEVFHKASACVVVVPQGWEAGRPSGTGRVAVGVDVNKGLLDEAIPTIRLAIAEAKLRHAPLEVLALLRPLTSSRADVHKVEESLASFVEHQPDAAGLAVEISPGPGHPAGRLVKVSKRSALVVIGAADGLDAASMRSQVVRHARCPVALARGPVVVPAA